MKCNNNLKEAINLLLLGSIGYAANSKAEPYVVKKGDTLYSIAKKNNTMVKDIKELNNLKSNKLIPGQKLEIFYTPQNSYEKTDSMPLPEDFLMQVDTMPDYLKRAENLGHENKIVRLQKHTIGYGIDDRSYKDVIIDVLNRILGYNQKDIKLIMAGKKSIPVKDANYLSNVVYTIKKEKLKDVPKEYFPKLITIEYYLPIAYHKTNKRKYKSINHIYKLFKDKKYKEIIDYVNTVNNPFNIKIRERWKRAFKK